MRVIGYDNAEGKGDHRHYKDTEKPYSFKSIERLLEDFHKDIERYNGGKHRVKHVKIGIKSVKEILKDTAETMKRLERGERLKPVKEPEIYFTSFEAFRKAMTPKRLEPCI